MYEYTTINFKFSRLCFLYTLSKNTYKCVWIILRFCILQFTQLKLPNAE